MPKRGTSTLSDRFVLLHSCGILHIIGMAVDFQVSISIVGTRAQHGVRTLVSGYACDQLASEFVNPA